MSKEKQKAKESVLASEKFFRGIAYVFMDTVLSDGKNIKGIRCYQSTTEVRYEFTADIYIDATGNGTLGYFAGSEYRIGREEKAEFREADAPDRPDGETMFYQPEQEACRNSGGWPLCRG